MTNPRQFALHTIVLALIVLLAAVSSESASAHAELTGANPGVGSAETSAPSRIELRFSEALDVELSSIALLGADGERRSLDPIALDPADERVMTAAVTDPASMTAGVYTVVWGAYSAEDGHASSGSFTFSAGTGEAPVQIGGTRSAVSSWSVVGKWLELIGLTLLAGLAVFWLTSRVNAGGTSSNWYAALAAIALVGSLLSFAGRVDSVSGDGFWNGVKSNVVPELLRSTYGQAWLLRSLILAIALVGAIFLRGAPVRRTSALAGTGGVLGLLTVALSGHAAAVEHAWLAVTVDFLHMAAASIWLGGLLGLLLVISPAGDSSDDRLLLRAQGNRFTLAVVLIVLAGAAAAYWHIGGRRSLQSTDYGRTLLVKIAIVAVLLGLAYYNRQVLQGGSGRRGWVPIAIGAELAIAMLILLFSADLSQTPPSTQPLAVQTAARAIELSEHASTGETTVQLSGVLTGDPTDEIAISVSPTEDLQRVIVRSSLSKDGDVTIGDRFDATQIDQQPGSYRFPAGKLGIAGPWQLEIIIRRAGSNDVMVTLPVDTSGLAVVGTQTVDDRWGGFRLTSHTALALVLAALMLVIGMGGLRRITGMEPLASGFLLAASIVIAAGFLVSAARGLVPVTPDHAVQNPIHTSPGVLTYAGDLYQLNCAICHGVDGRGAGGSNLAHLHGNDADLTGRAESQSDGDLRYWIENGVAGTRMPAFGQALNDDELWQLVLLIRQLQSEARAADAAEE